MLSSKKVILFTLIIWVAVTLNYLTRTDPTVRSHDFGAHPHYTSIIAKEKRLPKPFEGWSTYSPPLYYFINSFVARDSLLGDQKVHIDYVRYLSVFYGALSLLMIWWLLQELGISPVYQLLVLLFTATTPKYVFVFSTYNNDSLATMLCIAAVAFSYKLYKNWSKGLAILLLITGAAALYTKLTALFCIVPIIFACLANIFRSQPVIQSQKKIAKILALSIALLLPWAVFHNYNNTGMLIPSNIGGLSDDLRIGKDKSLLNIVLPTAILDLNSEKWKEPWAHPWPHPSTKRYDYWSYTFVNSVIGEFGFQTPSVNFIWFLLLVHLIVYAIALKLMFKSGIARLAASMILLAHLAHIALTFKSPYSCTMDYRYISWALGPWALLYGGALLNTDKTLNNILTKVMAIGIVAQIYFLIVVS